MAYRITNAMLKHNILKAIEEESLAMQHGLECNYVQELEGRELRCVVGTCLPPDLIERCRNGEVFDSGANVTLNGASAGKLHLKGLVEFEDVDLAAELQQLHDATGPYWGDSLEDRLKILKARLSLIPDETGV